MDISIDGWGGYGADALRRAWGTGTGVGHEYEHPQKESRLAIRVYGVSNLPGNPKSVIGV